MSQTAFCIHAPQEQIPKSAWLSHYGMEGKSDIGLFLYVTGAYHVNGKNECIRKVAFGTDMQYMALLHAAPVPPRFLIEAKATGADLVYCGKHVYMDVQKVARLTAPWFGPDWETAYDYLKEKCEKAGLKTAVIDCGEWLDTEERDVAIEMRAGTADTVDILIPCSWDTIPLRFWSALATMEMSRVSRILVCGEDDIVAARNMLVDAHLKGTSGRSLFFDVDMWFPADVINRLYAHDKDIVGGAYYQRQFPFYPHLYDNIGTYAEPRSKRIVNIQPMMKVDSQGTGCLMVKREVYEKIGSPQFSLRYVPIDNLVGEDINFALAAKEAGYESWADTTMPIGHIGSTFVNPDEANKYKSHWRPL